MSGSNAVHLGDGVYITATDVDDFVITANHHDAALASDTIFLDPWVTKALREYLSLEPQEGE